MLGMWTQEEAYFEGTYYQMRGAINQPKGVKPPHIPLLIGGDGKKVTLKLVAQYADACNVGDDPISALTSAQPDPASRPRRYRLAADTRAPR
jgi:alkanesulfonate monooxygenase SsuD/methylene tetrahydromethanopterin reductase-like flavin-dependent oxidoreductase (luciferase family)